jgi:hypothetical protein
VASFSVTGNSIDLAAPAVDIATINGRGTYSDGGGTSFAAPIVSGVAGLVFSVNPGLAPDEVQDILKQAADDLGPRGWDTGYGWGRVNAARAVQMAIDYDSTPDETPPSVVIIRPASEAVLAGLSVVAARASDDTCVSQVDLYDDDVLMSSDTVAPHEWTIDTTEMADGPHFLRAIAHDAAGNAGVSASVQVTVDNSTPCDCPPDCSEPASNEIPAVSCADGLDNDCDGAADCADSDCASDAACNVDPCGDGACDPASGENRCTCAEDCGSPPPTETRCTDGNDDDCDGLADGDDPDCIVTSGCGNGVCEGNGEDCFTCPVDCSCRGNNCKACCGDGACKGPGENKNTCPVDCAN